MLPIGVLISAAILKWLNNKIAKFEVSYSKAFFIELIIGLVDVACFTVLGIIGIWSNSIYIVNLIMLVLFFLLGAPFYARMLIHPEKGPIGWGKGIAYSLIFGILDVLLQLSAPVILVFIFSIIY